MTPNERWEVGKVCRLAEWRRKALIASLAMNAVFIAAWTFSAIMQ
jgi:hypothetical protein